MKKLTLITTDLKLMDLIEELLHEYPSLECDITYVITKQKPQNLNEQYGPEDFCIPYN